MRKVIFFAALLCLGLTLSLATAPAAAVPLGCDKKCTPSTPDHVLCSCPFGFPSIHTCGEWRSEGCGFLLMPASPELQFSDVSSIFCAGPSLTSQATAAAEANPEAATAPASSEPSTSD